MRPAQLHGGERLSATRMHDDEVEIDEDLVRRLIVSRHPAWSSLPIAAVLPRGTDNAAYRLGDELVVRLPRHAVSVGSLRKEVACLPRLAPWLPVEVPVPIATDEPAEGYPFPWAVLRWVDGVPATPDRLADAHQTALDLARSIAALQRIDASEGPSPGGRGGPLAPRDAAMRRAVATMAERVDGPAALALWEDALAAPVWAGPGLWIHGDLDARNVLARDGRICGVVDWGSCAVGDPACDVMVAWKMVPRGQRAGFRELLAVDDATWRRARGWVLSQALIALAYYTHENNRVLVDEAWRWLGEVLGDL